MYFQAFWIFHAEFPYFVMLLNVLRQRLAIKCDVFLLIFGTDVVIAPSVLYLN